MVLLFLAAHPLAKALASESIIIFFLLVQLCLIFVQVKEVQGYGVTSKTSSAERAGVQRFKRTASPCEA